MSPLKGYKQTPEHREKLWGRKRSPETRAKISAAQTLDGNSNWGGGRAIVNGYIYLKRPAHPFANNLGYVFEHRLVVEKRLGRFLLEEEVVHHINGITDDNRDENLQLFENNTDHMTFHNGHR